ncbi:hypothetical protein Taro_039135 [Colocasia esculenta]|uniref:Uncharacterized protein n=1 Tax=Colocasia esculenta TaxID=4460 RepID=A0A843WFS7_COLES|nr:hypothetical protein [Colocasia esculenta]
MPEKEKAVRIPDFRAQEEHTKAETTRDLPAPKGRVSARKISEESRGRVAGEILLTRISLLRESARIMSEESRGRVAGEPRPHKPRSLAPLSPAVSPPHHLGFWQILSSKLAPAAWEPLVYVLLLSCSGNPSTPISPPAPVPPPCDPLANLLMLQSPRVCDDAKCDFFMWCDEVQNFVDSQITYGKDENVKNLENRVARLEAELRDLNCIKILQESIVLLHFVREVLLGSDALLSYHHYLHASDHMTSGRNV